MRTIIFILMLAGLHWLANLSLHLLEFEHAGFLGLFPDAWHGFIVGALEVIQIPFVYLLETFAPSREYLFLPATILNSLVWGLALYALFRIVRGRRRAAA
jgi:hypothetical protein